MWARFCIAGICFGIAGTLFGIDPFIVGDKVGIDFRNLGPSFVLLRYKIP